MIKLIAFDWNGTLLADTQISCEASNFNLKHFGYKPVSILRYRQTFVVPIANFWLANGGKKTDHIFKITNKNKIFNSFYESRATKTRTRSGSTKVLMWLKNNQIESTIYSNHTLSGIEFQLRRLGIKKLISKTIARTQNDGAEHLHNRTKDKKLYEYVKSRRFKPQEILTIGDTEEEIEIGKQYGYHTVAITGGYNTTSRLLKHKPDFLIHNMKELIGIVKKLNK